MRKCAGARSRCLSACANETCNLDGDVEHVNMHLGAMPTHQDLDVEWHDQDIAQLKLSRVSRMLSTLQSPEAQ